MFKMYCFPTFPDEKKFWKGQVFMESVSLRYFYYACLFANVQAEYRSTPISLVDYIPAKGDFEILIVAILTTKSLS